jgi:hypothetical protein
MNSIEHNHINFWVVATKGAAEKVCGQRLYLSQEAAQKACVDLNLQYQIHLPESDRVELFKTYIVNGLISSVSEQAPFEVAKEALRNVDAELLLTVATAADPALAQALSAIGLEAKGTEQAYDAFEAIAEALNPLYKLDKLAAGA